MRQYQNYKSDFVLRESFLDITGKPVPLPTDVDFTLRYWTRQGHEYTASRQDGMYVNCQPEGDGLLVFFKDHNLCEGVLNHELHIALANDVFSDGVQNLYYPAELDVLLWDKASSKGRLESGVIADYMRGRSFVFEDFTDEQIEQLQRPAKEAAEQYAKALETYQEAAEQQLGHFSESSKELDDKLQTVTEESNNLLAAMQDAVTAAQEAVRKVVGEAEQATQQATTAAEEATAAKEAAAEATKKALSSQTQAGEAATAAQEAAKAAQDAAAEAEQATADAEKAVREAATAAETANSAAQEANNAGRNAAAAIENCETVLRDVRAIAERAEAAATAATAATAAAEQARQRAEAAASDAERAQQAADEATQAANTAAQRAETAAQHTEQLRPQLEELIERAKVVAAGVPTGLRVDSPKEITIGNTVKQYVRGTVLPVDAAQNVLYQSDGKAADIMPDGEILAKAEGTSTVQVIPTEGTRFYKTIQVAVTKPRIRLASGMRLDGNGNIRLT